MRRDRCEVNWIVPDRSADAVTGVVRWAPATSAWNGGMVLATLVFGPLTATPGAVAVYILTTAICLLLGHSVGYHRLLVHHSFVAASALRKALLWFGAVAGMNGPFGIIRAHDLRDWAQRQPACHPYLAHRSGWLRDAWWQLHCRLELAHPPRYDFSRLTRDGFAVWLERTWMLQQVPVAGMLFMLGGWSWVVWGVAARIATTVHGHWLVGYLAHNRGPQTWHVTGSGVQGHDVPWAAWFTMGEAWHNNHHAFPASARMGLGPGQADGGFMAIRVFERLGWASDVLTPERLSERQNQLVALTAHPPLRLQRGRFSL